ncbi:MAG: Competence protein ComEA [Thermoanaerobacterales bacterium 50_218]|nr:MAG: Competence protein ComEA [Thermoanaerobacterales bacterium 50_218]HAA90760.1 competence protein ComEA [Peptococcaceae bacterium]
MSQVWNWDRRLQGLVIIFVVAFVFAAGFKYACWQREEQQENIVVPSEPAPLLSEEEREAEKTIAVHVAGAVQKPGVYYFPQSARVIDAVEEAGLLDEADLDQLNLARILSDGEKVYVPRVGEVTNLIPDNGSVFESPSGSGKINLNTASAEELEELPGIGPVLAQRIIDYREKHGYFKRIEDVQNVSGIGSKRFEQIKDLVTI